MEKTSIFERPVSEMLRENAKKNIPVQTDDKSIYSIPDNITDEELKEQIKKHSKQALKFKTKYLKETSFSRYFVFTHFYGHPNSGTTSLSY